MGLFDGPRVPGSASGQGGTTNKSSRGGGGVIYAVTEGGELLWFRHDGRADGSVKWAIAWLEGGLGMGLSTCLRGRWWRDDGITTSGDLMWYRHDGRLDGSSRWADNNGKRVGTGWILNHVFSAGNGVIYAIAANGELRWYRHDGRADGKSKWATPVDKTVGSGWVFKQAFSGANLEP